ncbi:MAG: hypothetical protein WCJ31_00220 [Planctomycetia bacterium]
MSAAASGSGDFIHSLRGRGGTLLFRNNCFFALLCFATMHGAFGDEEISTSTALMDYSEAIQQAGDQGLSRPEAEQWIERLFDAAKGDGQETTEALATARRLANSIGSWAESSRIVDRELSLHTARDLDRARLCAEAGEIRRNLSRKTRLDADRKTAIKAFREATSVTRELPPEALAQANRQSNIVLYTLWIADLEAECSDEPEKSRSLASYRAAREEYAAFLAAHPEPVGPLAITRWTIPKIAAREAIHALAIERYADALVALRAIAGSTEDLVVPSVCIQEAANRLPVQSRRDVDGYVRFLEEWLRDGVPDDHTCFVRWALAEALCAQGDPARARPILADLRAHALFAFDKVEPSALEEGRGGTYSMVLRQLRDIEASEGAIDEALATNTTYLDLYPNEEGLVNEAWNFAKKHAAQRAAADSAIDAPSRTNWRRWILIGINVGIVAVISWLLIRRSHKPRPAGGPSPPLR